MKSVMKKAVVAIGVAIGATVNAADITWTGAVDNKWDTTTLNWMDANGNPCAFTQGDNVKFLASDEDRTITNASGFKVTLGTMLVNCDSKVQINTEIEEMTLLTKLGSGTLQMEAHSSYSGDIEVLEGELYVRGWWGYRQGRGDLLNPTSSHIGNPQVERTLHIGPNGTFYSEDPWLLGGPASNPKMNIVVDGTLKTWYATGGWGNAPIAFGNLTLNSTNFFVTKQDNTTIYYDEKKPDNNDSRNPRRVWESFAWNDDVHFNTSTPFSLEGSGGLYVGVGDKMPTLYVPDITGDEESDVILKRGISDSVETVPVREDRVFTHFAIPGRPSRFVKDGDGTLELWPNGMGMTGDIIIKRGTLRVSNGHSHASQTVTSFGNPRVERNIVLLDGTVLEVRAKNTMGSMYGLNRPTFVVTNATIRLVRKNGVFSALNLGNVDFYNGEIEYEGNGDNQEGYLTFGAKARFDGTKPFVVRKTGGYDNVQLSYGTDYVEQVYDPTGTNDLNQMVAYCSGCTEFDVCDMTGGESRDAIADLTIEPVLRNVPKTSQYYDITYNDINRLPKTRYFSCGLKKKGLGAMRLTSNGNSYTGATEVVEGAFLVDGKLLTSDITVRAGGLIGGTGEVNNVAMDDGAGFVVNCADGAKQLKVSGDFVVPEEGVIWLTGYQGKPEDIKDMRVYSRASASNAANVRPEAWKVRMDGYEAKATRNIGVECDDDTLVLTYHRTGLSVIVR